MHNFQSRGVAALVRLHEIEMRRLLEVWREAARLRVQLPASEDPDYASLAHLLHHPLRSARGYLAWICQVLGRPDPGLPPPPPVETIETEADSDLDRVLAAWEQHLSWMPAEVLDSPQLYADRWGQQITIEGMLEHAVVHPMRHRLQLEDLIRLRA